MEILDCEQGSADWFAARLGIPTASEFQTLLAKGRGGGESKGRKTYLYKLAGERLTGECAESYTNPHMERGKVMEEEARNLYAFRSDSEPKRVGFIREGRSGASPDSLLDLAGALEIKTKLPHLQLEVLEDNEVPSEHVAQCQGVLWIANREWIDFVSYWPRLPLFVKRVYRDERYIATLKIAVEDFNEDLDRLVEKFK